MSEPQPEGIWCLVANVAPEQRYGEDGQIRRGTKHFSPNTKVYCFPAAWGDGYENIRVIGRHRGSPRLITMIMPSRRLHNWRVRYVYHPYVVAQMRPGWEREDAEQTRLSLIFWHDVEQAQRGGLHAEAPDLHMVYAAQLGLCDEIQAARERGAGLDVVWQGLWTPLIVATCYGHTQAVELLLRLGATVGLANAYGDTALSYARYERELAQILERAQEAHDQPLGG